MARGGANALPNPDVAGAAVIWLMSLPGATLSVFLTFIKFRSEHRCDFSWLSACSINAWLDCNRVLVSAWSSQFGLPISAYSTAYFAALLGLTTALLWRPDRFTAPLRPLLLWLAWLGLSAVVWLAAYAAFVVRGFCSYCMVIYGLVGTIFLAARWMNPQGHRAGLTALFARKLPRRGSAALLTCLGFLALVSVQMVAYRRAAVTLKIDPSCTVHAEYLPETALRTEGARPRAEIALFLDLACRGCRREFEVWDEFVRGRGDDYRLSVYHYARAGACIPPDFPGTSGTAEANHSCRAALAVECVEQMLTQRGKGLEMLRVLFALQDEPSPYFTDVRLATAAREVGLDVSEDSFDHPFFRCLDDERTARRAQEHARFGMEQKITATPVAYLTFYEADGQPGAAMVRIEGAKHYGDIERTLEEARKAARGETATQPE